jgi:DNA helicase IV
MKKMILMVVAMLSMTMTSYAENENAENTLNVEAYDMSVNIRKLAVTLDMTFDQMESVEEIHRIFCAEMVLAAHANKDEREALVDKAVKKDLRYMRYILDQKQYKKYLLLLNTTLQNRGLK